MTQPATLEIDALPAGDTQEFTGVNDAAWGRLLAVDRRFSHLYMTNDSYTFGRDTNADYSFITDEIAEHRRFLSFSKFHFKIFRETTPHGCHTFIEDTSSNGTFLNGEKIGRSKKRPLSTGDTIAISEAEARTFMYVANGETGVETRTLCTALAEKYIVAADVLGRGAMGTVRLAFEKETCLRVAVKIIDKRNFSPMGDVRNDLSKNIEREVSILKSLNHPCIIGVSDVYETPEKTFIVMELVDGGEMFDRIVSGPNGCMEEAKAKLLFYQILLAVKYLHDEGITHRDLKPENILLKSDAAETLVKIADFGLSKLVDSASMLKTICGTPNYLAPEILATAGLGSYTKAVDMWSVGVILFVALSGYVPFSDDYKDMKLADQILNGRFTFAQKKWQNVSQHGTDLVKRMLVVDPEQRITADEALNHPWLKDPDMQNRARALMYPDMDGMIPPQNRSPKKRPVSEMDIDPNDTVGINSKKLRDC